MSRIGAVPVHPLADLFPLLHGAEFDALVADVTETGLLEPIKLWRGALIDGRNRLRAVIASGAEDVGEDATAERLLDLGLAQDLTGDLSAGDLAAYVVSLNLRRRHLDESQRALIAARLSRPVPVDAAPPEAGANLPLVDAAPGLGVRAAAELLNVSPRLVKSARALEREAPPDVVDEVARGEVAVSAAGARLARARALLAPGASEADLLAAYREMERGLAERTEARRLARLAEKQARRAAREADLAGRIGAANAALAVTERRYGVILADPEWRFEVRSAGGMDRSAENHYPCSDLAAIRARPVANLAAPDCALFLWATVPLLPEALEVMAAWGFTYRSHLVWNKLRAGTGYWFRNQHELLLIGTRGAPPCPAMGEQWTSVLSEGAGPHSVKPDGAYALIEAYFPTLPKIELNARRARPGWDAWGAEAPEPTEAQAP